MRDITLVIVDTINPNLASKILDYNFNIFEVKEAILFTNLNNLDRCTHTAIHTEINSIKDYNKFIINDLNNFINTKHILTLQIDGIILNPHLWCDLFLEWDYIGAPWPFLPHLNRVGNGGFSLRSKKFLQLTCHLDNKNNENEDHFLCRTNYNLLADLGLKIADVNTACKFALEYPNPEYNQNYNTVFGIHGKYLHYNILQQIYNSIK